MTSKVNRSSDVVSQKPKRIKRDEVVTSVRPSIEEMKERVQKRYRVGNSLDFKLYVPDELQEEGYHYHYINNKRSRIQDMEYLGYEIVADKAGKAVRKIVNSSLKSEVKESILMRIPQEIYDEIKKLRAEQTDAQYKELMQARDPNLTEISYTERRDN